jgi:GTPase SAR1 family protein
MNGIILFFDLSDLSTFRNLEAWIMNIKKNSFQSLIIVLVGNKSDLENQRKVSRKEAISFAGLHRLTYFETSVKDLSSLDMVIDSCME